MTKWEYKQVRFWREIQTSDQYGYRYAGKWEPSMSADWMNELGADGWELIGCLPESRIGGEITPRSLADTTFDVLPNTGPADYLSYSGPMIAGITTEVYFYFKRQKE